MASPLPAIGTVQGRGQLRAGAKKPHASEGGTPEGRGFELVGRSPRLRGGRPEAKHCFAKRERADTDVGPGGCTEIIIAAGRQRQQPTEAAGATLQMARVYLTRRRIAADIPTQSHMCWTRTQIDDDSSEAYNALI